MRAGTGGGGGLPVTKLRSRNLQDEGWALFKLVGGGFQQDYYFIAV